MRALALCQISVFLLSLLLTSFAAVEGSQQYHPVGALPATPSIGCKSKLPQTPSFSRKVYLKHQQRVIFSSSIIIKLQITSNKQESGLPKVVADAAKRRFVNSSSRICIACNSCSRIADLWFLCCNTQRIRHPGLRADLLQIDIDSFTVVRANPRWSGCCPAPDFHAVESESGRIHGRFRSDAG